MGVRLLHSLSVHVIFYVIFVPRYQFGEQGLTWWPVINFYSSAACAVVVATGNYVAGRPCRHKESYTFDWCESDTRPQWCTELSGLKAAVSFKSSVLD